jgi:DNA-binding PadR family transcriptional regulator
MTILGAKGRKEFEKQMLRHLFPVFLLWYISKREVHGYELLKTLEGEEGFRIITASKLYPILKEMTSRGLIAQKKEMQGKRARKIYHITEKGRSVLREARKAMRGRPLKRRFMKEMVG